MTKRLFLRIYFLSLVNFFGVLKEEEKVICERKCSDEVIYVRALEYYSTIKVNKTLVEKNLEAPLSNQISVPGGCNIKDVNDYIQCMGNQKIKFATDLLENCIMDAKMDYDECKFTFLFKDDLTKLIAWDCFNINKNFNKKYFYFYEIMSNLEYYEQNVTKYNNQSDDLKKLICAINKEILNENPKVTDYNSLYEIFLDHNKTLKIFNRFNVEIIKKQMICLQEKYTHQLSSNSSPNILSKICPVLKESNFDVDAILDTLFPLNVKYENNKNKTTTIIVIIAISTILIILVLALILYKRKVSA